MNKFNLGHCVLTIRLTGETREVFVENEHHEGPIWLAKGDVQIDKLIEILRRDDFESDAKKMLEFLREPRTQTQIKAVCKFSQSTMQRMIKAGVVESYKDTNNVSGKGQPILVTWYVATGKPYTFRKPKKKL